MISFCRISIDLISAGTKTNSVFALYHTTFDTRNRTSNENRKNLILDVLTRFVIRKVIIQKTVIGMHDVAFLIFMLKDNLT